MCTYSFVGVKAWEQWNPNPLPYVVQQPTTVVTTTGWPPVPTKEEWDKLAELVRKARLYDKIKDKADCVKPEIDAWMADIEDRLEGLEEQARETPTAEDLAEAIKIGLKELGFSTEGLEAEL